MKQQNHAPVTPTDGHEGDHDEPQRVHVVVLAGALTVPLALREHPTHADPIGHGEDDEHGQRMVGHL